MSALEFKCFHASWIWPWNLQRHAEKETRETVKFSNLSNVVFTVKFLFIQVHVVPFAIGQLLIQHCQKMPRLNLEIDGISKIAKFKKSFNDSGLLNITPSNASSSFLEDVKYTNLAGRIVPCGRDFWDGWCWGFRVQPVHLKKYGRCKPSMLTFPKTNSNQKNYLKTGLEDFLFFSCKGMTSPQGDITHS